MNVRIGWARSLCFFPSGPSCKSHCIPMERMTNRIGCTGWVVLWQSVRPICLTPSFCVEQWSDFWFQVFRFFPYLENSQSCRGVSIVEFLFNPTKGLLLILFRGFGVHGKSYQFSRFSKKSLDSPGYDFKPMTENKQSLRLHSFSYLESAYSRRVEIEIFQHCNHL